MSLEIRWKRWKEKAEVPLVLTEITVYMEREIITLVNVKLKTEISKLKRKLRPGRT